MLEKQIFKPGGVFNIEHYRDGKLLETVKAKNGVTDEGINHALDVIFHGTSAFTTWYIGLIDNNGPPVFASTDTYAGINGSDGTNGWNENTAYSDATRQEWTEGAASSKSMTNSTAVTFNINGAGTLKGIFLCSYSTKNDNDQAGQKLWATAAFSSTIGVASGDVLKVTYTITGASA